MAGAICIMKLVGKMLFALIVFSSAAIATEDKYKFATHEQEALFLELAAELRCPKCQNQNIADSNAVVAKDLRNKLHKLVSEGQDKQQIIDYMVARYGDFVYYNPPFTATTAVLWFGPVFFVCFGVFLIVRRTRNRVQVQSLDADAEKKIADLLSEDKKL